MEKSHSEENSAQEEKTSAPERELAESQPDGWVSGKVLAILIVSYVLLIILGGVIFHFIETSPEQETVVASTQRISTFLNNNTCVTVEELKLLIEEVINAYELGITASNNTESHDSNWDFVSSIFFATTIVTTIGYGNISPATPGGRVFTVFFALVGIPLFLVTSGQLGMRMASLFGKISNKLLKKVKTEKWKSILSLVLVFTIGFLLFSLLPAIIFTYAEGWNYNVAVYYTFITLTTIGFGDYYPEFANGRSGESAEGRLYRLFVNVWVIFGLVWMASTLSAISDAVSNVVPKKKNNVAVNKEKTSPEDDESKRESTDL